MGRELGSVSFSPQTAAASSGLCCLLRPRALHTDKAEHLEAALLCSARSSPVRIQMLSVCSRREELFYSQNWVDIQTSVVLTKPMDWLTMARGLCSHCASREVDPTKPTLVSGASIQRPRTDWIFRLNAKGSRRAAHWGILLFFCLISACSLLSNFCSALTAAAVSARSQASPWVTGRREVIPVSWNRRKTTAICPQPRVCQGTCPQGKCFWLWIICYNIPVTLLGMHSEVLQGEPVLGVKFSLWDGRNIRGISREGRGRSNFLTYFKAKWSVSFCLTSIGDDLMQLRNTLTDLQHRNNFKMRLLLLVLPNPVSPQNMAVGERSCFTCTWETLFTWDKTSPRTHPRSILQIGTVPKQKPVPCHWGKYCHSHFADGKLRKNGLNS